MTGAQLATLANTAALRTVLEGRDAITQVGPLIDLNIITIIIINEEI